MHSFCPILQYNDAAAALAISTIAYPRVNVAGIRRLGNAGVAAPPPGANSALHSLDRWLGRKHVGLTGLGGRLGAPPEVPSLCSSDGTERAARRNGGRRPAKYENKRYYSMHINIALLSTDMMFGATPLQVASCQNCRIT